MTNLFSFSGRVNRARYAALTVILPVVAYLIAGFIARAETGASAFFALLLLVVAEAVVVCQVVKRLHDIGRSGTHFWLLLIPLYNVYLSLVLLFRKGDAETNRYGPNPLTQPAELAPV